MSKKENRKALTTLVKEVTEDQMLVNLLQHGKAREMVRMGDSNAARHQMEQVVVCLVTRVAEILPQFSTRYSTFPCKPENLE